MARKAFIFTHLASPLTFLVKFIPINSRNFFCYHLSSQNTNEFILCVFIFYVERSVYAHSDMLGASKVSGIKNWAFVFP